MPICLFFFYIELDERYEFVGSCTSNKEEEFNKKVNALNNLLYDGRQEVVKIHTRLDELAVNLKTF